MNKIFLHFIILRNLEINILIVYYTLIEQTLFLYEQNLLPLKSSFLIFPYFIKALYHICKLNVFLESFIGRFCLFYDLIYFFSQVIVNIFFLCIILWKWFLFLVFCNPFLSSLFKQVCSMLCWYTNRFINRFGVAEVHTCIYLCDLFDLCFLI